MIRFDFLSYCTWGRRWQLIMVLFLKFEWVIYAHLPKSKKLLCTTLCSSRASMQTLCHVGLCKVPLCCCRTRTVQCKKMLYGSEKIKYISYTVDEETDRTLNREMKGRDNIYHSCKVYWSFFARKGSEPVVTRTTTNKWDCSRLSSIVLTK